jgi:hypothetical protein
MMRVLNNWRRKRYIAAVHEYVQTRELELASGALSITPPGASLVTTAATRQTKALLKLTRRGVTSDSVPVQSRKPCVPGAGSGVFTQNAVSKGQG